MHRPRLSAGELFLTLGALVAIQMPAMAWAADIEYDTIDTSYEAQVLRAPGLPESSVFAEFENHEQVSIFSGALSIMHPAGPRLPIDGGGVISLVRAYSSKKWAQEKVMFDYTQNDVDWYRTGDSWVGNGWTMHLGRIGKRSVSQGLDPQPGMCPWERGNYTGRQFFFEDPQGTQYTFKGEGFFTHGFEHAHPNFRIRFFTPTPNADDCHPTPNGWQSECFASTNGKSYYEVTYPNGTRYLLEKLVDTQIGDKNGPRDVDYIINHDRNGWYTTEIVDLYGNTIYITYAGVGAQYPEAITEVKYTHQDGTISKIWTELWTPQDPGYTGPANDGKLRRLYYYAYDSDHDGTEQAVYEEYYYGSNGHLTEVKLAAEPGSSSPGSIYYSAGAYGITRVEYPTGAVSDYSYWQFVPGEYNGCPWWFDLPYPQSCIDWVPVLYYPCEPGFIWAWAGGCPESCESDNRIWRKEWGVQKRTLYPDGDADGTASKHYTWTWDRFHGRDFNNDYGGWGNPVSHFEQHNPDGTSTVSEFFSYTMGDTHWADDPRIGQELGRSYYDAYGSLIKREEYTHYVDQHDLDCYLLNAGSGAPYNCDATVVPKSTTVTYEDDTGTCFGANNPVSARKMTIRSELLDTDFYWGAEISEGDYLDGSDRRLTYRHYFDQWQSGACAATAPDDTWIKGAYDYKFLEQGPYGSSNRVESGFEIDCNGRLDTLTKKADYATVSTTWDTSPDPLPTPSGNATAVVEDRVFDFNRDTHGNLSSIDYSGGDPDIDGTQHSYIARYTAQYGQTTQVELGAPGTFDYKFQDVTSTASGFVASSRDPNGLETKYNYDALRRLTEIDQPGSTEYSTRVVYPDLLHARVIQSPGSEDTFDSGNDEQIYSERTFDMLGRLIELRKSLPDGTLAVQVTQYDQMGRAIFVSEWMTENDYSAAMANPIRWQEDDSDGDGTIGGYWVDVPVKNGRAWGTVTFYGEPDPSDPEDPLRATADGLGRARRVVRADGSESLTNYCGPHKEVTVKGVRTDLSTATSDFTTRYYYDGLGRLALVDGPAEGADAAYRYDVNDNLIDVYLFDDASDLSPDPFSAWLITDAQDTDYIKNQKAGGQERTFVYDASGRLRESTTPEAGVFTVEDYDIWGNPLVTQDALAAARGYYVHNVYDGAGRLIRSEKIVGWPPGPAPADVDRLGGDGTFDTGLGGWVTGNLNRAGGIWTFTAGSAYWGRTDYLNDGCMPDPTGGSSGGGLYFGSSCQYDTVPAGQQAARHLVQGVTRDDVLSFKFWRQVRESVGGSRDVLSVYVVPYADGDSVANRRYLFQMNEGHVSYSLWRRNQDMRPGDLFSQSEWPEDTTMDLYLYVVFDKVDTETTGIMTGVVLDDIFLGRRGQEALIENDYDQNHCPTPGSGALCTDEVESANNYRGNLTTARSFEGDVLLVERKLSYLGLNGRLSGVQDSIDWRGVGTSQDWVTTHIYTQTGLPGSWNAPYIPSLDSPREYDYSYKKGYLDGLQEAGSDIFLIAGLSPPALAYNAAGGLAAVRFNNGASTEMTFDDLNRASSYTVLGTAQQGVGQTLWSSGTYIYDGAGNIAEIGSQHYAYDGVGRLVGAQVLPQAGDASRTDPYQVAYTYDLFGNMKSRTWSDTANPPDTQPIGMTMQMDFDCDGTVTNKIQSDGTCGSPVNTYSYDPSGNLTRMGGQIGGQSGAVWDERNRMAAYYEGDPEAGGLVAERYSYDGAGYRVVKISLGTDGTPVISLRDGSGQIMAEYTELPGIGSPQLTKDFVYGAGQLLVEREVKPNLPVVLSSSGVESGGNYLFNLTAETGHPSYAADIRTASGFTNQVTGITLDGTQSFQTGASQLTTGVTNYLRVRIEGSGGEPYSAPVSLAIDPDVDGSSENQTRALSVSRDGNSVHVRWKFLQENGKRTKLYYERADTGQIIDMTPSPLDPGVDEKTLVYQNNAPPCGHFYTVQLYANGTQTPQSIGAYMPPGAGQNLDLIEPFCGQTGPPESPSGYQFANTFHHRDHLGSLRIETDAAGWTTSTRDLYPFGMEMSTVASGGPGGSQRLFTGHERDSQTGLDYMLARSYSSGLSRFLRVDPGRDSELAIPQTWNLYSYVRNNPIRAVDLDGRVTFWDVADVGFAAQSIGNLWKKAWDGEPITGWDNVQAIGDAIGLLPVVPSLSLVTRSARMVHAAKSVDRTIEAAESIDKAIDTAKALERVDDVSHAAKGGGIPWRSWGGYDKVTVGGQEYAKVGDRLYTRHAVDRMQPSGLGTPAGGRGPGHSIAPNFVEDVIQNGTTRSVTVKGVERTIHTSGSVQVVTEQGGRIVVTVNPFSGGR